MASFGCLFFLAYFHITGAPPWCKLFLNHTLAIEINHIFRSKYNFVFSIQVFRPGAAIATHLLKEARIRGEYFATTDILWQKNRVREPVRVKFGDKLWKCRSPVTHLAVHKRRIFNSASWEQFRIFMKPPGTYPLFFLQYNKTGLEVVFRRHFMEL